MKRPIRRTPRPSPEALAERLLAGERGALARAITLAESTRPEHRDDADRLLERIGPRSGDSLRVAVSGVPGVGKSTFIDHFGTHAIARGHKVAVLTIDPSSALSGGSILGDKTRMQNLAFSPDAYIRPSAAAGTLGGVHRRTRESILLCEAAGFDLVLVETVGVGQSETEAVQMTDLFLLLLLPAGGDELQGIKRGIVELADLILVNKADGELAPVAGRTVADYRSALRLLRPRTAGWQVSVSACSALTGDGVDAAWQEIQKFEQVTRESGLRQLRRADQAVAWMRAEIAWRLEERLRADPRALALLDDFTSQVRRGVLAPGVGARRVIEDLLPRAGAQVLPK